MSWATTRSQLESILNAIGFTRAPEVFDIEKQPATFIDSVFCVQLEEMEPNTDGFGDVADRFYPTQKIKISVAYDVFNGDQDAYDAAINNNTRIVQTILNPNNRPTDVRMVAYTGSKTKLLKGQDNWLIIDNTFDLQVQVVYLNFASLLKFGTAVRDQLANSMGSTWSGGSLLIYDALPPVNPQTAFSGNLLATITIPTPAFSSSINGTITKTGAWSGLVSSSGTATGFRMLSSDGTFKMDGSVGISTSIADMILQSVILTYDGTVSVLSFVITQPE
jgi:hypothetical protein